MKKLLFILVIAVAQLSCDPAPEDPQAPEIFTNCSISVQLFTCAIDPCEEAIPIVNHVVKIYESLATLNGNNPIQIDSTNENGWLKFYDLNCDKRYFIGIDLGDYGFFVEDYRFTTGLGGEEANERLELMKGIYYNNNSTAQPISELVSLEYPLVDQYSNFKYFERNGSLDFDSDGMYIPGVELDLGIKAQLDENTYIIREKIDSIHQTYFKDYHYYQESLWRIENDSLYISSYDTTPPLSFIWNLTEESEIGEDNYVIPFTFDSSVQLDLNQDFEYPISTWTGIGQCSDHTIGNYLYKDLLFEKRNFMANNGPVKYKVFNLRDGILRSMQFFDEGIMQSAGFDISRN